MRSLRLALLGLIVASAAVRAEPLSELTTRGLYEVCKGSHQVYSTAFCTATLSAIGQIMATLGKYPKVLEDPANHAELATCLAAGTGFTIEATRSAFLAWVEAYQAHWKEPYAKGVMMALRETWPCPSG
jgi:hypothetical protein